MGKRREPGRDRWACLGTGEFTNKAHVITREVKGNTQMVWEWRRQVNILTQTKKTLILPNAICDSVWVQC